MRILRFFRDFVAAAPLELSAFFGCHEAPPAPFVPEALHRHKARAIVVRSTGPRAEAEAAVAPMRDGAPAALDLCGAIPCPALKSMFDTLLHKDCTTTGKRTLRGTRPTKPSRSTRSTGRR